MTFRKSLLRRLVGLSIAVALVIVGGVGISFAHDPELEDDGSAVGAPHACPDTGLDDPYWDGDINICDFGGGCFKTFAENHKTGDFEQYVLLSVTEECGCDDGRVNTNCSAPSIVYCKPDVIEFWKMGTDTSGNPVGVLNFSIKRSSMLQSVASRTLIKQVGKVRVYLMPDGRGLLVAPQSDGKDYYMYFDPALCQSLQEGAEWDVK